MEGVVQRSQKVILLPCLNIGCIDFGTKIKEHVWKEMGILYKVSKGT
jgi:hypothetical protein